MVVNNPTWLNCYLQYSAKYDKFLILRDIILQQHTEDTILKAMGHKKFRLIIAGIFLATALTACGEDPELKKFKKEVDTFCSDISEIDTAINNVDTTGENASAGINEVLANLDRLDERFQEFAELDFPEEFDYLENLADEASEYMTEAVASYRDASTNDAYNEETAAAQYEYALQNYSRAYKRIQIIITFLHGEEPEDVGLNTDSE